ASIPNTRALFSRSAAVLGRPRRTEASNPFSYGRCSVCNPPWYCSMGAAEDGRAPTEERSCVRGWDFFSTLVYVTLLLANTFLAINSVLALSVLVLMNSFKKRNRARA